MYKRQPECYEIDGIYYLFYSADWKVNPTGALENFRIGVARASTPSGPFTDISDHPIFDPGYPIIDANVFAEDGRYYLYYSRCCYEHKVDGLEESWIYGVELAPDFSGVKGEMCIRDRYRAKGPVTETLLSVVAIDDATALIAFGIAVAVAQTLTSTADVSLVLSILKPVLEIAEALLGGALLGVLFTVMLRFFKVQSNRMVLAIAFVLVTSAVANALNISALLTTMAMGAVFANLCKNSSEVMSLCDHVTPPVFMMFFVLSGAGLNLAILPSIGVVGVIYVVLRVMGKMAGAWFGATVMKADHNVRRWLGPALIPQAGVAIGLTVVAQQVVPQYAEVVRAVVLCGTLIYELVGPGVAKWTLQKAGEIEPGQ